MRDDQHKFMMLLGQPPARLNVEQVACVLNCQAHDVPILVSKRLLKPLGTPPANGVKYFSTLLLLEQMRDANWLAKMTNALHDYWRSKNLRKSSKSSGLATEPPDLKI